LRLCGFFCLCAALAAQDNPTGPLEWQTVLDWLPLDTQTLVVAPQPFTLKKDSDNDDDSEASPIEALRNLALGRLDDFAPVYDPLVGRRVSFAVAGVRSFDNGFCGLGLIPYTGGAVIAFSQLIPTLDSVLAGVQTGTDSGAIVFSLSTVHPGSRRDQPEQLHLFVTQLDARTLAVATDRDSLHLMLGRRMLAIGQRALPRELLEWNEVDTSAPVFALRHFRHSHDAMEKAAMEKVGLTDPYAVSVVYNAQPIGPIQTVYSRSRSRRQVELARNQWTWTDEGLASPKVSRLGSGALRVAVPTPPSDSHESTGSFLILLLAHLGFSIAL
jgi:hypothetical protein